MNKVPDCLNNSECREIIIDAQVPIKWALPLYGYAMPIIVAITLATNSFIVIVLSRRHLRTPTNLVLLAMAVTELLTGFSCLPWLLYYYTFSGYKADRLEGLPSFWCSMFPYMASILPSIFHNAAIWLTVYLAVQRYIYICLTKLVQNYCTAHRSKQIIAIICIASIWIYAPELFATYNQSYQLYNLKTNKTRNVCLRIRTVFIKYIGNDIYYYSLYGLHTLLSHTLPCILLVCFTWKLISAIRVADERYAKLIANRTQQRLCTASNILSGNEFSISIDNSLSSEPIKRNTICMTKRLSATESKRVQNLKQNTRMLIAVILLFLFTEIPAALIFSLHVSTVSLRITFIQKHYTILNILLIVRNVLIVVTYPFRFAIYCGMSQQFRKCVRQMIIKLKFIPKNFSNNNGKKYERSEADSLQIDAKIQRVLETKCNKNGFAPILFEKKIDRDKGSASISSDTLYAASIEKGSINTFYCANDGAYCINNNKIENNETSTLNNCDNFVNANILIKNGNNKAEYYERNLIITKNINLKTKMHIQNNCDNNRKIDENEYENLTKTDHFKSTLLQNDNYDIENDDTQILL